MAAGNAQQMREAADVLDKFAQAMAPTYAAKTGKSADDMLALLTDGKDHWYTAAEAKDAGFADEISAAVAVEASFDLRRFKGVPAAAAAFSRSTTMPDNIPAAQQPAAPQPVATPVPAQPAALAVVQPSGRTFEQTQEIKAAYAPFMKQDGVAAAYTAILENPATTVEAARAQLLKTLGEGVTPATPAGTHIEMGVSDAEKFRAAAVTAIRYRASQATAEEKATIGQNPFRAYTMMELAKASLDRAGFSYRHLDPMSIAAAAITQSTSDFPVLLEEVINKTLRGAYATQPDTWNRFCARGSVSDFKVNRRYRLGSFANLDTVAENGEFKNQDIPDGEKSTIQAATKGNIINLSRQMIINDDIGAFSSLAAGLGRAAKRSVEADVYALLMQNSGTGPTMDDTGIMFNTTAIATPGGHANRVAYAAPTVALLDGGRQAMMAQMDPSRNDYLDVSPVIAVTRPSLYGTLDQINRSQFDPTAESNKAQSTKPNIVSGMFRDIVSSPRVTVNAVYLFADPGIAPAIEVVFLNGNDQPFLDSQVGFRVDGIEWKVRLDYGVAAVDYRGAYGIVGS